MFFLLINNQSYSQKKEPKPGEWHWHGVQNWHEGEFTLTNGDQTGGTISYNFVVGVLHIKTDTSDIIYGITDIQKFAFFDEEERRRRSFQVFSLPGKRKDIYEVIAEADDFAFLSVTKGIAGNNQKLPEDYLNYTAMPREKGLKGYLQGPNYRVDKIEETFLYISSDGLVEELVTYKNRQNTLKKKLYESMDHRSRKSNINKKELIKILRHYNDSVPGFIKKKKLEVRKRSDFVKVLRWIANAEED